LVRTVLFCGGKGLRLRGASDLVPKPMVPIGERPLLWHIMKYYAHYGHCDFILCLGYQAEVFKEYFGAQGLRELGAEDWRITFADTGLESSIGERFAAVRELIADDELFLANYGDTVTDVPLPQVVSALDESGKVASLLSVRPNYTFNVVASNGSALVSEFQDIADTGIWINGGYFVFRPQVFDYIREGEDLPDMFRRLIAEKQLLAYPYEGFWAPMDTLKDKERLEELVANGQSAWQVWDTPAARAGLAQG
jgi:glucose-1-phosphate cytidylyltransferase